MAHNLLPDTQLVIYCLSGALPAAFEGGGDFLGNWEEDGHAFLFFLSSQDFLIERLLREYSNLHLVDRFSMTYGEWQGGTIEPLKIGRFILNPPWLKASPGESEIAITFDPGLVFGNGTHPTTLTCITAIEIVCRLGGIGSMLDLGTGTGLLALVGASLGCSRVVAVDNNFLAAHTAQRNVRLNGLERSVHVINGQAEVCTGDSSDLLVANIHYPVLREIIKSPGFLRHKWFILSGLQDGEARNVEDLLGNRPVTILKRWVSDGFWHTLLGITESMASVR